LNSFAYDSALEHDRLMLNQGQRKHFSLVRQIIVEVLYINNGLENWPQWWNGLWNGISPKNSFHSNNQLQCV